MIEIEKSSGNVYADLESPDAGEMLVKARLATKIGEIIKHRHLTQQQAADILGMTQPKLSAICCEGNSGASARPRCWNA